MKPKIFGNVLIIYFLKLSLIFNYENLKVHTKLGGPLTISTQAKNSVAETQPWLFKAVNVCPKGAGNTK